MITAIRLFYIIGGLIFYHYKIVLEPKLIKKLEGENFYKELGIYPVETKIYKVIALVGSIFWPIALITNFMCLMIGILISIFKSD